jgi:FkbH-like protein
MQIIALTATFTAEPLLEPLHFWMNELDNPCTVKFAPYNQVFQQLLDPDSTLSRNQTGMNVVLIRLEDWWRGAGDFHFGEGSAEEAHQRVERNTKDLLEAMKFVAGNSRIPHLLCFCPASVGTRADENVGRFFDFVETQLAESFKDCTGIYVVRSEDCNALYPVGDYEDQRANEVSHVPYTLDFFNALGTMIARRFYRIQTPPHKVLVLDCDNTLWKGVCGEDGTLGVEVGPGYRALQEFVIAQREAGMLVCLCSKNDEEDVWSVFEKNPRMLLKREHFVSSRINWQPKSENMRSLSTELQLGLDSFLFLDDSGIECAEVEAHCPEVLTLQLPGRENDFKKFLTHIWAFDHLKVTEEDRQRSALYVQNTGRKQLLAQSLRLDDFLAGLELQIEFLPMTKAELPRVAQLTQRTNQFNFTGVRRSENGLAQLCSPGNAECRVVRLRDRFGDYGLVGAMIYTRRDGLLDVDNVLLSCRALGRRVEHRMLSHLGCLALREGRKKVRIHFIPSGKNKPAQEFLEHFGAEIAPGNNAPGWIDFESERLAELPSPVQAELAGRMGSLSTAFRVSAQRT